MADFDNCFQVNEEKGLKIICLKPVLYNEDIEKMLAPPTLSAKTGQTEQWTYVFEKQYPDNHKTDTDDFNISLDMAFKDDLLNEIHLPERFLVILPKPFLVTICKTMGNAEVNRKEYSAKGIYKSKGENQIQVPKQNDVIKFLGNPFVWREPARTDDRSGGDDANAKLLYEYRLKQKATPPEAQGSKKTVPDNNAPFVWVEFTFQKTPARQDIRSGGDGTLLKAEANLCGIELSLSFVPDAKKDEEKR